MVQVKLFVLAFLIACVSCDEPSAAHARYRECHAQTMNLRKCCGYPSQVALETDPDCKEHFDGTKVSDPKERHKAYNCFMECTFNKSGVFDKGEFDKVKLVDNTVESLTKNNELDFKEIVLTSIDFCVEKVNEMKANFVKPAPELDANGEEVKKCSYYPGALGLCIRGNIVRHCPATQWTSTEECEAFKTSAMSMEDCMKS